jgi:hypothetical protein
MWSKWIMNGSSLPCWIVKPLLLLQFVITTLNGLFELIFAHSCVLSSSAYEPQIDPGRLIAHPTCNTPAVSLVS